MLVLFCCAMAPGFLLYWVVLPRMSSPLFSKSFLLPTVTKVTPALVFGSLLFGLGWSMGGFCPGPSVVGMMSGDADYISFSYGLYFAITLTFAFRSGISVTRGWALTGFLGLLPGLFYLFPLFAPVEDAKWQSWPLHLAVIGGFLIGLAAFILMVTTGRLLGMSTLWRKILEPTDPSSRVLELVFFVGFLLGGLLAVRIEPQAFSAQPPPFNHLLLRFLGGVCVAIGTDYANGCTSGHGVCGVPRLSIRSIVAVACFMASVFICKAFIDKLIH